MNHNINPWYVTGITDADGCFSFTIIKSDRTKVGWIITLCFHIAAANNPANMLMLNSINSFFNNIGTIILNVNDNTISLYIKGLKNCLIVREHFINYPLLTYKLVHFTLWSMLIDLMLSKEHLTLEGLLKIVGLKEHFKMGISDYLLSNFPNYIKIPSPVYNPELSLLNIHWLAGFINGDGSFFISLRTRTKGETILESYTALITISQNIISKLIMDQIIIFLGFGSLVNYSHTAAVKINISSIVNINKFITLFKDTQFLGAKSLDYRDFCQCIDIINNKEHLTKEGKDKIRILSNNMNSTRTKFE